MSRDRARILSRPAAGEPPNRHDRLDGSAEATVSTVVA
jgi:hypothetical protein